MAISSTENRKLYQGDGTSTAFAFPYSYQNQTDLKVKTRNGTGSGTSESDKTLTSHYTVAPTVDATAGGTITFLSTPDATTTIVIYRDPPQTQTLDLQNDGEMPAESVEKAFDKLTLLTQRIQEQLTRAAVLSQSDTTLAMTLPYVSDRTSSLLAFDASGRFISVLLASVTQAAVSPFVATLLDDLSASAFMTTLGISGYAQTILDDADASTARNTLGVLSPDKLGSNALLHNISLDASVGANTLTLFLRTRAGGTPSASDPAYIAFRNATATTGAVLLATVTSGLSLAVPDTIGLGLTTGTTQYVYAWALNNSLTTELALSGSSFYDEGGLQTSLAIATATSLNSLYSAVARSSVPVRLLGRIAINLAASNHWSNAPTEISNHPFRSERQFVVGTAQTSLGSVTNTAFTITNNDPVVTVTAARTGLYKVWGTIIIEGSTNGATAAVKIFANSGTPTTVFSQEGAVLAAGVLPSEGTVSPYLICRLIEGSTYGFTIQGKASSGQISIRSDQATNGHALIAEEL